MATGDDTKDDTEQPETADEAFARRITEKAQRRLRARNKNARAVWHGLGTFGMVGWSVAIPTLLGVLLGIWLDRVWVTAVPWTLVLLLTGLTIGCVSAWQWVQREHEEMIADREEQ